MVNYSTDINKSKNSINSDGQLFHRYQQIKKQYKQRWSTIPPISIKQKTV